MAPAGAGMGTWFCFVVFIPAEGSSSQLGPDRKTGLMLHCPKEEIIFGLIILGHRKSIGLGLEIEGEQGHLGVAIKCASHHPFIS